MSILRNGIVERASLGGSVLPTSNAFRSLLPYASFSTFGDSIPSQGTSAVGASAISTGQPSPIHIARQMLGNRIYFPPANNLAVSGSYSQQIALTASSVIASGATHVLGNGGRNDFNAGSPQTAAYVLGNMFPAYAQIANAGQQLLIIPILPETADTLGIRQQKIIYNRICFELCSGLRPDLVTLYGFPTYNLPIFLDDSFMRDFTNGNRTGNFGSSDGIHLNYYGGWMFARQIVQCLSPLLAPHSTYFNYFEDIYNASTGPNGTLCFSGTTNDSLMGGTTGSKLPNAGITPSGNVATRWRAYRNTGSSTATMVCSKEVARQDYLTGTGQVIQLDWAGDGVANENYVLTYLGPASLGINSNIIAGKSAYATGTMEHLDNPVNCRGMQLYLTESGNTSPPNQSTVDGAVSTDSANLGPPISTGPMTFRTQPFTVQASTTSLGLYCFIFTKGNAAGHCKVALRDIAARYY